MYTAADIYGGAFDVLSTSGATIPDRGEQRAYGVIDDNDGGRRATTTQDIINFFAAGLILVGIVAVLGLTD